MKKILALLLALALVATLTACSGTSAEATSVSSPSGISYITLKGKSVALNGNGAIIDGSTVTITSGGTYSISGTLKDGQIIVNTREAEDINLVLNGVDITCSTSAPIYIINAQDTIITLADGTENRVTDGETYVLEDEESNEPNAAIFSKADLTIEGDGSLTVNASYNNGIQSKDDLEINGGTITVNAVNDAIKGRDSITIDDANITLKAGGDGMQSDNDEDEGEGNISIGGGVIDITSVEDGIQANTVLTITGGTITISSGGGSINGSTRTGAEGIDWSRWNLDDDLTDDSDGSAKGLKSGDNLTISGGTITIDSSDDSIHSNDTIIINDGIITMASGDDGIHADSALEINGGEISITKSYEGIESSVITINDGDIHVVSSDDGMNLVGGVDGSSINGRPGQNMFESSGNNHLYINGGYLAIDAMGDGIDCNGPIDMTGGTVIINGPTRNDNGALDYAGEFKVTGGYLVAAGSSGMAQAPSTSSSQYSILVNLSTQQLWESLFHIETENGKDILTFAPTKLYQSVVICSAELKNDETYLIYTEGTSTGEVTDSLYSGGTYTGGTQVTSLTISDIVTKYGSSGGFFAGGGGRRH
jgi:hypothetical protein